ncbi:MAG: bifunctional diguanylate cyclase/phosphodiesterase [Caloramator sp.]|nr:bifunctional diguanylate cyclase/phosphodiesterase [Caloramator sp.]
MGFKKKVKILKTADVLDSVTNLFNRTALIYKKCREDNIIVYVDIDNFKLINDTYGHLFGDLLLKRFSEYMEYKLQGIGNIYRYSGDDFVIIFEKVDEDFALNILDEIKEEMKQSLYVNDIKVSISLSAGLYKPFKNESVLEAVRKADIALHEAKNISRSLIIKFTKELEERIVEKTKVVNNVYNAMRQNEICAYYQPIYSTKKNKITDLESLVRWNSSILGPISPAKFIPIIEEAGYIKDLDEYVLKRAVKDLKLLLDNGINIQLSLNVSAETLSYQYIERLLNVLEQNKVSPEYIKIEITETAFLSNKLEIIESVKYAKQKGIKISFDDFGAGYSSIRNLMIFPFDEVKLDKIFIDKILIDDKYNYLAKKFIEVCHYFNYEVVAEGVETKEQFEALRELGCDKIQGYYIEKALPIDKLQVFLQNG